MHGYPGQIPWNVEEDLDPRRSRDIDGKGYTRGKAFSGAVWSLQLGIGGIAETWTTGFCTPGTGIHEMDEVRKRYKRLSAFTHFKASGVDQYRNE